MEKKVVLFPHVEIDERHRLEGSRFETVEEAIDWAIQSLKHKGQVTRLEHGGGSPKCCSPSDIFRCIDIARDRGTLTTKAYLALIKAMRGEMPKSLLDEDHIHLNRALKIVGREMGHKNLLEI